MNIGDHKNSVINRYQTPVLRAPQTKQEAEGKSASSIETTDSFSQTSGVGNSGLIEKKGTSSKSFSPIALGKSAVQGAMYVVGDLIPGAIGAGISALRDTFGGGTRGSHFEHKVDGGSEAEAAKKFQEAKQRLLNPNDWKELGPGFAAASFQVYSQDTKQPLDGPPKNGDYLKIGLPDPFPYVWVQIESISTDDKKAEVVVRPSVDPTSNSDHIAHFFSDQTANVFRVSQEGSQIVSSVTGVDEKLNTSTGLLGKVVAAGRLAGAWMGAKKPQWNAFTRKMVEGPTPAKALRASGINSALEASSAALSAGKEMK